MSHHRCSSLFVALAALLTLSACGPSEGSRSGSSGNQGPPSAIRSGPPRGADASDLFFAAPTITTLTLTIEPAARDRLAENPREYVRVQVTDSSGQQWPDVAVKLKGAAGSFRELADKPAFTLRLDKYRKQQTFHGLTKVHLNNSVQDETYLNEWLCGGLFREAGIPAARVTHARVLFDGRDLGLYVLKEGLDRRFIARHFTAAEGNLYDSGFCQDIDVDLERDAGRGDDTHADQHALLAACQLENPEERWQAIPRHLDVEAFLTFAAMELMTGHWDGYCQNHNNYRLYFDSKSRRGYFLPHGMDQMFGDPGASILDRPGTIVTAAVMENETWRTRYRERIRELVPLFDPPQRLLTQIDERAARVQAALATFDPDQAAAYPERIQEFKDRVTARAASLREQRDAPEPPPPQPLEFTPEGVELADWEPHSEAEGAALEFADQPDPEHPSYLIRCGEGGPCIASWRRTVLLAPGSYRFAARAAATDIAPLEDEKGLGAGIRISGQSRTVGLAGTVDWQPLEFPFEVSEGEQPITLVIELRATAGQVLFDAHSLRLFRNPDPEPTP